MSFILDKRALSRIIINSIEHFSISSDISSAFRGKMRLDHNWLENVWISNPFQESDGKRRPKNVRLTNHDSSRRLATFREPIDEPVERNSRFENFLQKIIERWPPDEHAMRSAGYHRVDVLNVGLL